ncbi:hypothetical protein [Prescottella equi]|uniref:hypothetical protein n=1 Tax=Rhodococcus hoagii TaxID=43767 RepID=UPI0038507C41
MHDQFHDPGQSVAQAAAAMTDVELDAAIAALHERERRLLIAGDVESARQVAMDKSVCLSDQARRGR